MPNAYIEPSPTAVVYDGRLLHTGRRGTSELFQSVKDIMTFRVVLIVADDGEEDFGTSAQLPTNLEPFPFTSF